MASLLQKLTPEESAAPVLREVLTQHKSDRTVADKQLFPSVHYLSFSENNHKKREKHYELYLKNRV